MQRLALALAAATAAAALVPALADAARVSIRVEGRTQTIFAKAPRRVEASNPLEALRLASVAGEFFVNVRETSFGPFVDQIGRFPAAGASGWVYKVNGVLPPVGADQFDLKDGDSVLWYWADFDPQTFAGPRTLELVRTRPRCYAAFAVDDQGNRAAVGTVRVWITGIPKRTSRSGRFCLRRTPGLVHVTKQGFVRSNGLAVR